MESDTDKKTEMKPSNPHDRFAKKTVGNPLYASDFLKHYADPIVAKHVNLDHLQKAPTNFLSEQLKEIFLDISFVSRLHDANSGSEVLMFLEHKSKPNKYVALQLWTQASLALYCDWTAAGYSDSTEKFVPKIPLMLVLYNGDEEISEELFFQDIFKNIPAELRQFVPQFKIILINLKHFDYHHLPGNFVTQAIVESLKRATDGTFAEFFVRILELVKAACLGTQQTFNLTDTITRYCTWTSGTSSEQIVQSITKVFKGSEGIEMATTIQKGILQEGIEIGELKGKVDSILTFLRARFKQVPQHIVDSLNRRTDAIALESLVVLAATCSSLDEFAAEL
jgi:hypothetical protein